VLGIFLSLVASLSFLSAGDFGNHRPTPQACCSTDLPRTSWPAATSQKELEGVKEK
jgi:hypothetical protein